MTLFKAARHWRDVPPDPRKWNGWPRWKRSLKVYCRSGTAYLKSSTRLAIDDDSEIGNEGAAGRSWFTNAQCIVSGLPAWPNPTPADPENDPVCRDYAQRGFMTVKKAASLNVRSRSVSAHVVRTRAGERWGVVVFDSREPEGVSQDAPTALLMELTAYLLTRFV